MVKESELNISSFILILDIQAPSFNETCPSDLSVLADEGKRQPQ